MATTLYYLNPIGVGAVASGSGNQPGYNYSGSSGDQGHGWQGSFTWTNTQFTAQNPVIILPTNARDLCITFKYTGAATVTMTMSGCNDNIATISAGSGVYAPLTSLEVPQIVGGASSCGALPGAPISLSAILGGSGSTGSDTVYIAISCNTIIRP